MQCGAGREGRVIEKFGAPPLTTGGGGAEIFPQILVSYYRSLNFLRGGNEDKFGSRIRPKYAGMKRELERRGSTAGYWLIVWIRTADGERSSK